MQRANAIRSVEPVLQPRTVAIVGASDKGGGGWSRQLYDNLSHAGFPAETYLINPRREEIWGQPCYPNFAALPKPVDLALMVIPADFIPAVLQEGVEHGLRGAMIYAAQFGEGGDEAGRKRADAVRALTESHGLRVSGPNCMGSLALERQLLFYPSHRVRGLPTGPVGVVFQSGGTFQYWLQQAAVRGLGFSYAVSSGNELDLDLVDYLDFLVEDASTRVIACLVEGIRRPEAFMAVAGKALKAGKPIVMVKIGRSAQARRATESHTGALAGDDQVIDAVCRKFGVIRCHDLDEMIETTLVLQAGRFPEGDGVAVACYSGGARGLMLDYADEAGLAFPPFSDSTAEKLLEKIDPGLKPENPLDAGASSGVDQNLFSEICREMAADTGMHMLAIQGQLPLSEQEPVDPEVFRRIVDATDKPVFAFSRLSQNVTDAGRAFQRRAGIPFVQGVPNAARATRNLLTYAATRRQGLTPLPASTDGSLEVLERDGIEGVLENAGLSLPKSVRATTAAEAATAAAELGFPVVLKLLSPQASHKTEVGGVALGLASEAEVVSAAEGMVQRLADHDSTARVDGFLIQEMVEGLEILVGVHEDPDYGPLLTVGLGGIFVEALRDVSMRLLPATDADVRTMLGELRGARLLEAWRGKPARDVDALVAGIQAVARTYLAYRPWLSDLEINPIMVREAGRGVRAVDVRAIRRQAGTGERG